MKKICLIISMVACLLCFTACADNNVKPNDVVAPDVEQGQEFGEEFDDEFGGEFVDPFEQEQVELTPMQALLVSMVEKAEATARMAINDNITAETATGFLGITSEEFTDAVEEAVFHESGMMPANQSICLVKVNDASKLATLKQSIFNNADPIKWVCMSADRVVVVDNGDYILLVMGESETCDRMISVFDETMEGTNGEVLSRMVTE